MRLNSVSNNNTFHSVREFIESARVPYGLTDGQASGFIVLMKDKGLYYMKSEKDFIPYLRTYLGKK